MLLACDSDISDMLITRLVTDTRGGNRLFPEKQTFSISSVIFSFGMVYLVCRLTSLNWNFSTSFKNTQTKTLLRERSFPAFLIPC